MKLQDLLPYENIVIQCHDDPDADAIASSYALSVWLTEQGKTPRTVYGGRNPIQKSNLKRLVEYLQPFNLEYAAELEEPDLLITVDCQPGEGNVTSFSWRAAAIIDHHEADLRRISKLPHAPAPEMTLIQSNYGSCSTVLWQLLTDAGYPVNENQKLATALYYGLYMDTGRFQEISHPLDKEVRDTLKISQSSVTLLQNSNLSRKELGIVSRALANYDFHEDYGYAIAEAESCDPNILGIISDLLVEVDVVDACIVFCVLGGGAKFSVRSCIKEIRADELALYIAKDRKLGKGGGHQRKAGGYLKGDSLALAYRELTGEELPDRPGKAFSHVLTACMNDYFKETLILDSTTCNLNMTSEKVYQKKPVQIGFVPSTDLFPAGTGILLRMLEGERESKTSEDSYIMIGAEEEIYAIDKETFEHKYDILDQPYTFSGSDEHREYDPKVFDLVTGESRQVLPLARACRSKDSGSIYARQLTRRVKLFTPAGKDKYMLGEAGDWLAAVYENPDDVYIVKAHVFDILYGPCEEP